MLFADAFTPDQYVLLGLLTLGTGLYLRRGWKKGNVIRSRKPLAEARESMRQAENTPQGIPKQAEENLTEYTREIEGRVETRIERLDQLIVEADKEIARLEETLETRRDTTERSKNSAGPDLVLHPQAREGSTEIRSDRAILAFFTAGYAPAEIAILVSRTEDDVRAILDQREAA
jgi:hypothetical protein